MSETHTDQPTRPLWATDTECRICHADLVWWPRGNGGEDWANPLDPHRPFCCQQNDEGYWERHEVDRRPYYVNVYQVDQHYGGPEEGGWWYQCGEPVASTPFTTRVEAEMVSREMRERFPRTAARYRTYGSDDFEVLVQREFATAYPTERPRYE